MRSPPARSVLTTNPCSDSAVRDRCILKTKHFFIKFYKIILRGLQELNSITIKVEGWSGAINCIIPYWTLSWECLLPIVYLLLVSALCRWGNSSTRYGSDIPRNLHSLKYIRMPSIIYPKWYLNFPNQFCLILIKLNKNLSKSKNRKFS